jgi:ABC-type dipeptide/oligopeptide/nickel transport system permease subunit
MEGLALVLVVVIFGALPGIFIGVIVGFIPNRFHFWTSIILGLLFISYVYSASNKGGGPFWYVLIAISPFILGYFLTLALFRKIRGDQ